MAMRIVTRPLIAKAAWKCHAGGIAGHPAALETLKPFSSICKVQRETVFLYRGRLQEAFASVT